MTVHQEMQYLDLVKNLLENGDVREERTGVGTRALFGQSMRFDLSKEFPAFTTKRVYWKTAFKEMLWMLSGGRNIKELLEQNVHIWSDWPWQKYCQETGDQVSMEEFEQMVLSDSGFAEKWGDLGPVYGYQWRHWPTYDGGEIDQIQLLMDDLQTKPTSRRLIFEGWNVAQLDEMALPPCHKTYQFFVSPQTNKLSCALMQRSADILFLYQQNYNCTVH